MVKKNWNEKDNGSMLKYYRKRSGLSQKDLADLTGIHIRSLQRYETEEDQIENMRLGAAHKISQALGIRMEDLLQKKEILEQK